MRRSPIPTVRAASTYCCRRTPWVEALASREKPGMKIMPMAIMAFRMFVPKLAIRTTASSMAGEEENNPLKRHNDRGTRAPQQEEREPRKGAPGGPTRAAPHRSSAGVPGGVEGARQAVRAELVGPQQMGRAGTLQHRGDVQVIGRVGRDRRREDRRNEHPRGQEPADDQQPIAPPVEPGG